MGGEKRVDDRANALSETEQKWARERKHQQEEDEIQQPREKKAQRDNLRDGKGRGGMTPPPRANS